MNLPWSLRYSPIFFMAIAAIKFVQAVFVAVGANAWARGHAAFGDMGIVLAGRVLDVAIIALAWVGSAIIAKLLLVVIERISLLNAQA